MALCNNEGILEYIVAMPFYEVDILLLEGVEEILVQTRDRRDRYRRGGGRRGG